MVKICAALNCLNNSVIGNDLTWFPLPKNEVSRERWIKLLGIKVKDAVNPGTRVCCDHFCTKDFLNNSKKFLKAVAIPSLNLVQLIHCAPKVIKVKNHDINSYSNVEILDVQPKTIESKPPAPLLLKQRPNAKPPLVEARPSRRAAQAAAEKIQKTVEKYGLFEGNEDDEMYVDEPDERDPSPPPVKQFSESPKVVKKTLPKILSKQPIAKEPIAKAPIVKQLITIPAEQVAPKPVVKPPIPVRKIDVVHRKPLTRLPCNLQMECEDDALSKVQVDSFRTLYQIYDKFEKKIEAAKRAKDCRVIYCVGNEIPPPTPPTIINTPVAQPVPAVVGLNTQNVLLQQTQVVQQPRLPNNAVLQSGMLITGASQIVRPVTNQQIIFTSASNAPSNNQTSISAPYKVLVDPRTGLVVGTFPSETTYVPAPAGTIPIAPKQTAVTTTVASSYSTVPVKQVITLKKKDPKLADPTVQQSTVKDGNFVEYEYNVVIKEGTRVVTAQSLLSIRAVTPLTVAKEIRDVQKLVLKEHLEKDQYSSDPLKWWLKLGIFDNELNCPCTSGRLILVSNKLSIDGYSWQCNRGQKCGFTAPVTRMIFFSRFGASLSKLHRLIYHWAAQSDALEAIHDSHVDIYMIRAVWRGIQDVCTRALNLKAEKLGGSDKVLELAIVRMGHHYIFCLMDRKSKLCRMKVVSDSVAWALPSVALKTIEPWLSPKSMIMTTDANLCKLSRKDVIYVHVDGKNCDHYKSINQVKDYLENVLGNLFGDFVVSHLKQDTIQGFLDELQWRDRYGKAPKAAFWNIMKDIAEQSGNKVTVPAEQSNQISIISSSSSSSESEESSVDTSEHAKEVTYLPQGSEKKKSSTKVLSIPGTAKPQPPEPVRMVELSSFYYARKEADILSVADNNVYQFKCMLCSKVLDNNIKMMKHLMAHMESNRQHNPDLSDLTQCKYCFRDFETPYSMQCHMETVHLSTNELSCKICNMALSTKRYLIQHMNHHHVQSEMPYGCQSCGYRSSFHREVIEHFHQVHNATNKLLCHYCLKIYNIKASTTNSPATIQGYYYHLYKHQFKSTHKKCSSCCMVFLNITELKLHKNKDHVTMADVKGTIPFESSEKESSPILINAASKKHKNAISGKAFRRKSSGELGSLRPAKKRFLGINESSNSGLVPSRTLLLSLQELVEEGNYTCIECHAKIDLEHFAKVVNCSKCNYTTQCVKAFVEHMISSHSNLPKKKEPLLKAKDIVLKSAMVCPCGFSNTNASLLAVHLEKCKHKTVYGSSEKASMALLKIKLEPVDKYSIEAGSAFFPPLVVLDENEHEFVNATLSKIPEPSLGEKKKKASSKSSKALSPNSEEKPSAMLNALGLVRRRSDGESEASDAPPLLIREDQASNKIQFEDRQGPSRNTRGVRSVLTARSNDRALNKEILDCMANMDDPPILEPQDS